jgi:hypothetical protein
MSVSLLLHIWGETKRLCSPIKASGTPPGRRMLTEMHPMQVRLYEPLGLDARSPTR